VDYSIETLKVWAFADADGFEVERVLERKQPVQTSRKAEDHTKYLDVLKKWSGSHIHDKKLEQFIHDVSLVCRMVIGTSTTWLVYANDEEQYQITTNLSTFNFFLPDKYDEEAEGKVLKWRDWNLATYMKKHPIKFPLYNRIGFKPNPNDVKNNELNTWPGFKAEEVDGDVDMRYVEPFLHHIRNVWADGNDENCRYLLSWLCQIIRTPERPTDVGIVLQSDKQGTGKTLPCNILIERVFGRNLSTTCAGLGALTGRFNSSVLGKIFTVVNEMQVTDVAAFNGAFEQLKTLITDRMISVEKKGIDHIQTDNLLNLICCTNHTHTIKIEGSDRRYACFNVSDRYVGDYSYFDNLVEMCDNDAAGNHIFTFFKREYPADGMVNLRKIPSTPLRKDMMENSKSSPVRFIGQVAEIEEEMARSARRTSFMADYEEPPCSIYDFKGDDGKPAFTVKGLYEAYDSWCVGNNEKKFSSRQFASAIKPLVKNEGRKRINGNRIKYIQFE
jgi:hypothetical protein